MFARILLISLLLATPASGSLRAADGAKLVGSDLLLEQAVSRSDVIFVGHFSFIGNGPTRDFAGEQCYANAMIRTSQPLKNSVSGPLTALYAVHPNFHEIRPSADRNYIIFVHALNPTLNRVQMLLPATDDNIRKVNELIPLLAKAN
jgi:hypothetical protein